MAVRVRVPLAAPYFFPLMKKFAYILILISTFILTSCGVRSGYFKLEGKLLNLNQGEFYVYSLDGNIEGVDTIKVIGGRFTYETPCHDDCTLMLVFPNFSEQPIFAGSGESVEIKGDASHLKEMEIKGTKENELMTKFRKSILNDTPPQEKQQAELFIKDHADSRVSLFLVRKYFVANTTPDYNKASQLLAALVKEQPNNTQLSRLKQQVANMKVSGVGAMLPQFTSYDINGKLISYTELKSAPVAVIYTWATYNYDSQDLQRELRRRQRSSQGKLKLMGFCLDASKSMCQDNLKRDSIGWSVVCNGEMLENKTLKTLGLTAVPDNIILQNGKIIARGMKKQELYSKLDQLLK